MSTTFSISGFGFSIEEGGNQVTAITGPATLALTFEQDAPVITYTQIPPPDGEPGVLPDIDFGGDEPLSATVNGVQFSDDLETAIGRISWTEDGQARATDVLSLYVSTDEQFLFVVGGDPLPSPMTPSILNTIVGEAVSAGISLPPSSSVFPPDTPIALAGLDGWTQSAGPEPVALSLTGISFEPEGIGEGTADIQDTQLVFAFSSSDTTMSYTQVGITAEVEFDGVGFAVVEFDFTAPLIGFSFGGREQSFDDGDFTFEMGRFVTSAGTHDILFIDDHDSGRQYLFQLGGAPLSLTTEAEFLAFMESVQSLDPIPDGDPLGQGQVIVPGSLPGVVTTPLVPFSLAGYQVGYNTAISDDAQSIASTQMTIFAPEGGVFSYSELGSMPDDFDGVQVELSSPGLFFVQVPGLIAPLALTTQIVRLTDDDGVTYDILEFINPTGGNSNLDFFFQIGGPELSFTDLAEFNAFRATIVSGGAIPAGDPLAPDTEIPLAGLGFPPSDAPTPPAPVQGSGNPAIVQLNGYRIDEDDDDNLLGFESAQLTLALSADDNIYSYTVVFDPFGDGFESIDISGPGPYAFLIDGVVPYFDVEIGIERVTVDGIDYDLMLVQIGDSGSTYVFQIDGSTPLPFSSFAAVQDFIEKADDEGAFSQIPLGSPFAPNTPFTFLNSPYAVADTNPQIIEGGDFWRGLGGAEYGRGADTEASLTVVNGANLTLNANGTDGPFLSVGRNDGYGVVTVAGAGSSIDMIAGGGSADPNWGASVSIGRDGGFGRLNVLDDARFSISDPVGTTSGPNFDGNELFWVGRGANGVGVVDVISASFEHKGTGTIAAYGRQGGEGYLNLEFGATYRQETTSNTDFTQLAFGRDGGFGEAEIYYSRLTVQAAENGNGSLEVGLNSGGFDAPNGILRIYGDGEGTHGAMLTGGANSPFVEIALGRNGGGLVDVNGGYFGVLNRGVTYDDDLNLIDLPGDGGVAEMNIGRDGGRGMIVANNDAEIFVSGADSARMHIGAGNGSLGEVFMTGSDLRVYSMNGEGGVAIGAWNGGTGSMSLNGASDADIWGANGAYLNVGRETGNVGTLVLSEMSDTLIRGDSNFTSVEIGAFGGSGQVSVLSGAHLRADGVNSFLGIGRTSDADTSGTTNGTLVVNGAGSRVYGFRNVDIGEHDASGTLRVEDGAAVQLGAQDGGSSLFVGRFAGSNGTLIVSDAMLSLYAPDGGAEPYTAFGYMGGSAWVDIDGERGFGGGPAHGFIQLGGGDSAFATLDIGRGAGSNGVVHVNGAFFGTQNNGTSFSFDPPYDPFDQDGDGGRATIRIGLQGGAGSLSAGPDAEIFAQGGAEGAAFIVGEAGGTGNFTLAGGELIVEGAESVAFLGIGSGGVGEMTMSHGAQARIELLSGQTGFQEAGIGVGYEGAAGGGHGDGTLIVEGAGTELEVVSARFANLALGGVENGAGDGLLRVRNDATLSFESVEHQQLNIGRSGGAGLFEVLDGGSLIARTSGAGFNTYMLVGTEGGSGDVRVDNASLSLVSEGGGAGIRIGTRWTHTDNNTGNGSLVLENGANAVIEGTTENNFWVGGQEGGNGTATIRSGSALMMAGDNSFAIIGGVFGETNAAGGTGILEVEGAGSSLVGANTVVVGFNNGAGTLNVLDGGSVELDGNGARALLGIGVHASATGNGGIGDAVIDGMGSMVSVRGTDAEALIGGQNSTGALTVTNGARVEIVAGIGGPEGDTGALLEIGRGDGHGTVSLSGTFSELSVTGASGADGAIRVAAEGAGGFGLLHIADGATASAGSVTIGSPDTKGVVILADDGELIADTITVNAEGVLGGTGTITGNVVVNGGAIGAGDTWDVGGGPSDGGWGIGTLRVQGEFTQTGGEAYFDFGATGNDLLDVIGALSFSGTEFTLVYNGEPPAGDFAVQLAYAAGGISLEDVVFGSNLDAIDGFEAQLELREGGTELWFATGPSTVTVSGMVSVREVSEGAVGRQGTQVSFNTEEHGSFMATTDVSGAFSFDVPVGASGTLELVRDYDPGVDKALSVDDVVALFQLVMHPDPASVYSPLDMLAADFDRDGQATVDDVIALFGHVMSVPGAAEPGYVFIDSNNPPTAVDTGDIPLPEAFVVAPLVANTDLSLTAILAGDLFGYHT